MIQGRGGGEELQRGHLDQRSSIRLLFTTRASFHRYLRLLLRLGSSISKRLYDTSLRAHLIIHRVPG